MIAKFGSKVGWSLPMLRAFIATIIGFCMVQPVWAATPATPATLLAKLQRARDGEVIELGSGNFGMVTLPARIHAIPIVLDASRATFAGIVIRKAEGVVVKGGSIQAPGGRSYGILIDRSAHISIEGMKISGAHRGLVINVSSDVSVTGNTLTGIISDGIDIALSRRVLIDRNTCRDFTPTPAVYDNAGKRLRDGDHPDCIQAWSRPSEPPTADITVTNNDIEVSGQGIFFGNHIRSGIDDGGFDRVRIEHNRVRVGFPNAIAVGNGRNSVVRFNDVSAIPGSVLPNKPIRVRANINVSGDQSVVCGNKLADFPRHDAAQACR